MAASVAQELASCVAEHNKATEDWSDLCQKFTRTRIGAPAWALSAREAFNAIPAQFRHTSFPPPAGAPTYFGYADRGQGHADFSAGGGQCWTTDAVRQGKIDLVPWDWPVHNWDLPYRGWISWAPGVGILNLVTPPVVRAPSALADLAYKLDSAGNARVTFARGTDASSWVWEWTLRGVARRVVTEVPTGVIKGLAHGQSLMLTITPRNARVVGAAASIQIHRP